MSLTTFLENLKTCPVWPVEFTITSAQINLGKTAPQVGRSKVGYPLTFSLGKLLGGRLKHGMELHDTLSLIHI